jgi:hypothetical protein
MSSICVSNILPSRTRSGRPWNTLPQTELERAIKAGKVSCPVTPDRRPIPVMPTTPTKPRVNRQALDVLCRATIYLNLLDEAKDLYRQQIEYARDIKSRERKFELMSAYQNFSRKVNDLIELSKKDATLQEIDNYSELVGWTSRMSVFHQLVCVL